MTPAPNPVPPPRWARRLLSWLHPAETLEEVQGDLEELYAHWYQQDGKRKAGLRYGLAVLSVLPPLVRRRRQNISCYPSPHPFHPDMLRNYITIAYRNLVRQKGYSFINIGGLSVGMAVAMLIGLWLYDELSFNAYHQNRTRVAQVLQNQTFDGEVRTWWSQAMQLAPELRSTYGNHFKYVVTASWAGDHLLSVGDKTLTKSGNYMEPDIAEMLTLKMRYGTRTGLQDLNSVMLSESVADALFGNRNPMGNNVRIDQKVDVIVTGVYEDLPANSTFANLGFIAPFALHVKSEKLVEEKKVGWGNSWFQTVVQIADGADMREVSAKIKYAKLNAVKADDDARFKPELLLHPMDRWHLHSEFANGVNAGGRIEFVWLFGVVGAFVLLLACINFMNLATARSEKRAREVGVRKTMGSLRTQLIGQFLSESLLVAFLSFGLAAVLALLMLPLFNQVADKKITMPYAEPLFWAAGLLFTLLTGVLAGSYPAFYLSAFHPVKTLKGTFRTGRRAALPRKALVVVQFTVSVTLVIGTLLIYKQIQHAKNRPIGYSRDGVVTLTMKTEEVRKGYEAFRDELLNAGVVTAVAQAESPVTNAWTTNSGFQWKGKDPAMQDELVTVGTTHDFGKVVGWQIKEGRDFSTAFATDSAGFILNETAVKYMGFNNPIDERIKAFGREYKVVGVVKDLVMQSLYQPVRPMVFYIDVFNRVGFITLKINPQQGAGAALEKIGAIFKHHYPATPFEYEFADDDFARKYQAEQRIGDLAAIFAVLTVLISCLGLFGLSAYTAEQRTKEIGIRKVLGASVTSLWGLLSKDFVGLVLIAFAIATPLAYYFLSGWLENYEYRTDLSWWVFALAGGGALLITLLTVSFQAIKAALNNPVKSLRME
jgi:ABC-type antimicrobial peptide transport system permease subunit